MVFPLFFAPAIQSSLVLDNFELRTPLNATLGWSRLLLNHQQDEVMLIRCLEMIELNARMQPQLIEDLFN
ncbi:hypothetical protein H6G97_26550 [Nostoc flagelliforme FACHB-838]|uniref:histidine kinase n=1 Tax=Nostoc flagelliforme FACHB-838 TaxID=2692904 RepID=A0ABR8DU10_9NOSO|nr:hypothetical protein [Nostoc flagelliforme FACHB-838]